MQQENAGTDLTTVPQNSQLEGVDVPLGYATPKEYRTALQNFNSLINLNPLPATLEPTPDGKAQTVVISHVEMNLDKLFYGLWHTENFKWAVIGNEVVGSLELIVVHPVTQKEIRRTGAAGIIITMNKAPDGLTAKERSEWANDPNNKKSNALDLGFPKLKSECLKNAAQSLGKVFGRDLNRKKAADATQLGQKKANGSQKAATAMASTEAALREAEGKKFN